MSQRRMLGEQGRAEISRKIVVGLPGRVIAARTSRHADRSGHRAVVPLRDELAELEILPQTSRPNRRPHVGVSRPGTRIGGMTSIDARSVEVGDRTAPRCEEKTWRPAEARSLALTERPGQRNGRPRRLLRGIQWCPWKQSSVLVLISWEPRARRRLLCILMSDNHSPLASPHRGLWRERAIS